MKEFIKRWMLVFAMVVISAFVIGSIMSGQWESTSFILKLLITTLAICLLQLLTNRIPVRIHLLKYLINLGMVLSTVLFFGWMWKWYTPKGVGVWVIFATVIPVFIAAIILDVAIVRRDVDIINKQIKHRRQKLQEENSL